MMYCENGKAATTRQNTTEISIVSDATIRVCNGYGIIELNQSHRHSPKRITAIWHR